MDDQTFAGVAWEELRKAAQRTRHHASALFVADSEAMGEAHPNRLVDLSAQGRPPFRCAADRLWSVDNNLNLANMDWGGLRNVGGRRRRVSRL